MACGAEIYEWNSDCLSDLCWKWHERAFKLQFAINGITAMSGNSIFNAMENTVSQIISCIFYGKVFCF